MTGGALSGPFLSFAALLVAQSGKAIAAAAVHNQSFFIGFVSLFCR